MCRGVMEPEDEKKKLNDDLMVFMRKRSETEAPHYTARLKTYVDIKQKHRRAAAARRYTEGYKALKAAKKDDPKHSSDIAWLTDEVLKYMYQKSPFEGKRLASTWDRFRDHTNEDDRTSRRFHASDKPLRLNSINGSMSAPPSDRCGRRRRRRSKCCRRRRRSCRRRRRSCRRRRSRRRRRRSCRRRRRCSRRRRRCRR